MKIVEETKDFMALEVAEVEQSIVNLLTETLNSLEGVLYAGYRVEHPLTGVITISLKVDPEKISPRESLMKALTELDKIFENVETKLGILR